MFAVRKRTFLTSFKDDCDWVELNPAKIEGEGKARVFLLMESGKRVFGDTRKSETQGFYHNTDRCMAEGDI